MAGHSLPRDQAEPVPPRDRAIGFRVEPRRVHWAVVEGSREAPRILAVATLNQPKTFTGAQTLAWYVAQVTALCSEHRVGHAWIREAEGVGQQKRAAIAQRSRIEGAIIAAVHARGALVTLGPLGSITAKVKPGKTDDGKKKSVKAYLEADEFRGIDWSAYEDNQREAILAAVAANP